MQNRTVFEVLGIEPTDDFTKIKKAYIRKAKKTHPDKNKTPEAKNQFQEIGAAYAMVDSPEKLHNYFKTYLYQDGRPKQSPQKSTPTFKFSQENVKKPQNALSVYKTGTIDIFVPVSFAMYPTLDPSEKFYFFPDIVYLHPLPSLKKPDIAAFQNSLDLLQIANAITHMSTERILQIGMTAAEAKSIANQHKFYTPRLIVQVSVPLFSLSDITVTEKDLWPDVLNAKDYNKFFILAQDTRITVNDIVSISAMRFVDMENTMMGGVYSTLQKCWPEGYRYVAPTPEEQMLLEEKAEAKAVRQVRVM